MEALQGLLSGIGVIMTPSILFYCFIGSLIGTLIGVLPGIGPLAALALLMPVTFGMSPVAAMAMLAAMFYGAMYGGSTTSILINLPGEAASVVTCLDGHQMARKGRAGAALGIAAIGSFIAGTLGLIALTFFSPALTRLALGFGPPEYFALMTLGLVCALLMSETSPLKGLAMIALGVVIASVGMDAVSGEDRLTFGSIQLSGGLDLVALVIGLFGISEILLNLETTMSNEVVTRRIGKVLPTRRDFAESWRAILRGSGLGFLLGVLPGGGPVTASFLSYTLERRIADRPERFGEGAIEGVAGPESANNSAVVSSMIPLLSLGLPGNAVTALLMGALVIHGVQPGPGLIEQRPDIFWGVVASMYVGNVFLLILNLPLIGIWVQLLRIPYAVLFPLILLLAMVGAYSANKNFFDMWMMLSVGFGGYLLRKAGYELAPLVLTIVLAPMMEQSLRQSMVMSPDGAAIFLGRPASLALMVIAGALIALIAYRSLNQKETRNAHA